MRCLLVSGTTSGRGMTTGALTIMEKPRWRLKVQPLKCFVATLRPVLNLRAVTA